MSDKHLTLMPHRIRHDPTAWWYEEPNGICVVQEYYRDKDGLYLDTRSVIIPWRALKAALKRKEQKP